MENSNVNLNYLSSVNSLNVSSSELKQEYIKIKSLRKNIQKDKEISEKRNIHSLVLNQRLTNQSRKNSMKEKKIEEIKNSLFQMKSEITDKKIQKKFEDENNKIKVKLMNKEHNTIIATKREEHIANLKRNIQTYKSKIRQLSEETRINQEREIFYKSIGIEQIRRDFKNLVHSINPARQNESKIKDSLINKIQFEQEASIKLNQTSINGLVFTKKLKPYRHSIASTAVKSDKTSKISTEVKCYNSNTTSKKVISDKVNKAKKMNGK